MSPAWRFVSDFLVPLVRGGSLAVARPLGPRAFATLASMWPQDVTSAGADDVALTLLRAASAARPALPSPVEKAAALDLQRVRALHARSLVAGIPAPPLDLTTLRLGAALHNLIALTHPALQRPEGRAATVRDRTLAFTTDIARVGSPQTVAACVFRHTLLARVSEIVRPEYDVTYWLGKKNYVGRPPPARLLRWHTWRRVDMKATRRRWLGEVGVPVGARPIWDLVQEASPLGEALEPMRLDPPLRWERMPAVLRFAPLCRLVVGRVLSLGLPTAGEALVLAFFRHATQKGEDADVHRLATADGVRFFAHLFWLHHLAGAGQEPGPALAALLVAALDTDLGLVLPPDVRREGGLGAAFVHRIASLRARVAAGDAQHTGLTIALCRYAASTAMAGIAPVPLPPRPFPRNMRLP